MNIDAGVLRFSDLAQRRVESTKTRLQIACSATTTLPLVKKVIVRVCFGRRDLCGRREWIRNTSEGRSDGCCEV